MAGVDVGGGGSKRKTLDSEVNMIPMIDLLMVTISFLLITAVWSHMARLNADAQVPGPPRVDEPVEKVEPEKQLHIEMKSPEKFVLIWKQGATTVNSIDVARKDSPIKKGKTEVYHYQELQEKITAEWKSNGSHQAPNDTKRDQAILHTDNKTEYKYIVAVIDAIYATRRDITVGGKTEKVPALNVTFAVN